MAGYSGTPLTQKLGIKPAHRVALIHAPAGFAKTLTPMPDDVRVVAGMRGSRTNDVAILFARDIAALADGFVPLAARLAPNGGLWVAWPKKASGVVTDINEAIVRRIGLAAGLVDNKVCAIDELWSGLRFVYRVKDRPASPARGKKRK